VLRELEALHADPFAGDVKRIKGKRDIFRLRIGRFRAYFRAAFPERSIEILLFDDRGAIKNKDIQRL
jgi:mRNA-degrading endonuclease RelE of RelBE toxin-antitoxin system